MKKTYLRIFHNSIYKIIKIIFYAKIKKKKKKIANNNLLKRINIWYCKKNKINKKEY